MLKPDTYTESAALVGYLDDQLQALRTAAHGLTDELARATPLRSALSIGALLKHVASICEAYADAAAGLPPRDDRFEAYLENLQMLPGDTLEAVRERFDAAVPPYLAAVAAADLDAETLEDPAPWFGLTERMPANKRFRLLHHVEEFARHAGHADIIREELDGATAGSLLLAVQGLPGNAFLQPWTPLGDA